MPKYGLNKNKSIYIFILSKESICCTMMFFLLIQLKFFIFVCTYTILGKISRIEFLKKKYYL